MSNQWDNYAEDWDKDTSVQDYANNVFSELTQVIKLDGLSVLDFGCGTGTLTELFSPIVKDIVALDGSEKMIEQVEKKKLSNVSTVSGFLTNELIADNSSLNKKFDLIIASSVCSFLPNYEETLRQLKTLLKKEGTFIQFDWLGESNNTEGSLTKQEVQSTIEKAGFGDIKIKYPFSISSGDNSMKVIMAIGKNI